MSHQTTNEAPHGQSAPGSGSDTSTAKEQAPHPDDSRKPDSPDDITKPGWKYTLRKAMREFGRDECTDNAAGLTYYAVLAIPPALLALVSILGVVGDPAQTLESVMSFARTMGVPDDALQTIEPVLTNLTSQQAAGFALVAGLLGALWSASGYVKAFSRTMNRIYEVDEGRPFWKLIPMMLLVTLVTLILVAVIVAAMVLSGPIAESVGSAIGLGSTAVTVWNIAKWPVIVALAALAIAILYYATPNIQQPKFTWMSVGAVVAIIIWALGTVAFGFYVANFGNYNETYGALAGVILFLLWLWITNNALLFGAELDSELERSRQLQAGIEAEEDLQLPPRDTYASKKKQKKHQKDIEDGRALRLSGGEHMASDDKGSDQEEAEASSSRRARTRSRR